MKKRDEISSPESCLNRADDDEDVFVLLGRDTSFAITVIFWCLHRVYSQRNTPYDHQILSAVMQAISANHKQSD